MHDEESSREALIGIDGWMYNEKQIPNLLQIKVDAICILYKLAKIALGTFINETGETTYTMSAVR